MGAERFGIHIVDRRELRDVGDEHGRLGNVGEIGAAVAQDRGDVRQDLARLRFDAAGNDGSGGGIEPDLPR